MSSTQRISDIKIQSYFPKHLYQRIKQKAAARHVSMAQVIREAVEAKVFPAKPKKQEKKQVSDLMQYAGTLKGGPKDFSENPSKYLKRMYKKMFP